MSGCTLPPAYSQEEEEDEVEADGGEAHEVEPSRVHALALFGGEGEGLEEGPSGDLQQLSETHDAARQAVLIRVYAQVGDAEVHQDDDDDQDQNGSEERQACLPLWDIYYVFSKWRRNAPAAASGKKNASDSECEISK